MQDQKIIVENDLVVTNGRGAKDGIILCLVQRE